ncbi:GGDEF domain-containing protein [Fusibacter sp. Q10-2]|uniref:GGDEF domain-containing protein n=2 Tax=Fusibacter ferrireducens TaxID=2785058 RepID=A0ABR9ZR49_9FIRM|nr:GGDEF domain-containing protein [Fusibacter ferrireducens]
MKEYHRMITQLKLTQVELKDVNAILKHASITDELTKLYNRRYIMDLIESHLKHHINPMKAVIMIDIDFFKKINDQFGHGTGDFVLKRLGEVFTEVLSGNPIARIGGEEFLAIIYSENAPQLAETLRTEVEHIHWDIPDLKVSISAGVYELMSNENLERLLERADASLYKAKAMGRNQVYSYNEF